MESVKDYIARIEETARQWLQPDNYILKEAIDRTVNEGLFGIEDIKHQVRALKQNIEAGQIEEWARRSGLEEKGLCSGKKVLCLHAGNLPLVGFQTALGVIMTGASYHGKLSRKDPWLLRTFLDKLSQNGFEKQVHYSVQLDEFENVKADTLVFAGSEETVPVVEKEMKRLNALKQDAQKIIRTAKFSIAYIEDLESHTMQDLTEAIFRYGGQGCRSVAMVVTEKRLDSMKCGFTDYVESFWLKNPQHKKPSPALQYQFAYNKAIGRSQAWLDDFLLQESEDLPNQDFMVNWIQGDQKKVRELWHQFGKKVQTVYTTGNKIEGIPTELLSQAQKPPLWWKPDGVDVIQAIISQ